MWWSASIAPTATWRRADRGPIRQKSRYRAIHIWTPNSLDWTTSKRRRFSDILVTALSPIRRGPGSYQYRVKLKRRGPAVKHPPGFFVGGQNPGTDRGRNPGTDRTASEFPAKSARNSWQSCQSPMDFLQVPDADGVAQAGSHAFGGGASAFADEKSIRRSAVTYRVPCITTMS